MSDTCNDPNLCSKQLDNQLEGESTAIRSNPGYFPVYWTYSNRKFRECAKAHMEMNIDLPPGRSVSCPMLHKYYEKNEEGYIDVNELD